MKQPQAFFVISRYNEDVSWISQYTSRYLIYNRGEDLPGYNQKRVPNFGGNQYDTFRFIYDHYNDLPDVIAFMQGNPFDHCYRERFDSLIHNTALTPLFGAGSYLDGHYSEHDPDWPHQTLLDKGLPVPETFKNFDQVMEYFFEDYVSFRPVVFPPGSQIIVEKERCLHYSRDFWKQGMNIISEVVGENGGIEAHIIERCYQTIFENIYKERIR